MANKKPCFDRTIGLLPSGAVPECVEGVTETIFWYVDVTTGCLEKGTQVDTVSKVGKKCVLTTEYLDKDGAPFAEKPKMEQPSYVIAATCSNEPEVPPEPPVPVELEGVDCDGNPVTVTGEPGQLAAVVQAPGTVFKVQLCTDDKDFELACGVDPATGHEIQTAYRIEAGEMVIYKRWDTITGEEWTGDPSELESCAGTKLESDGRDVCVDGENLTQWIVKKDGAPTGTVYYTSVTGQLVDVAADAIVSVGVCIPQCASVPVLDCENALYGYAYDATTAAAVGASVPIEDCDGVVYGYIMAASAPGHTKEVKLGCDAGAEVIGYAADIGCASEVVQESDPVDVCVDGVSATRWQIKENGVPTSVSHYTDANGVVFVPAADAVITLGSCPAAACEPTISSAFGDDLSPLLPGNSIAIQKPSCCAIKVITSAGEFLVRKGMTAYSTADFNCPVTVDAVEIVSGNCDVSEIIVTTQALG